MLKRTWSIICVTLAVLLSSSTLVAAAPSNVESSIQDSNLELNVKRGARAPAVPFVGPSSTSEPGDDDAPNKEGNGSPQIDENKGPEIRLWSFKNMGTGIRLHLLKWISALR